MMFEDLLTLADSTEYYKQGAEPWPEDWKKGKPEGENKVNDNIKLLLRDRDRLQENLLRVRRMLKRVIYFACLAVLAAWSPLWLPLLMKIAGLK